MSTRDADMGLGRLMAALDALDGAGVEVGFLDGGPEAMRAAFNEYGTATIPARPFVRSTFEANADAYLGMVDGMVGEVLRGKSGVKSLRRLGARMQRDVQQAIDAWSSPPNAPATIRRKGHNNPLVDTGSMRRAVRWRITVGGGVGGGGVGGDGGGG